MALFPLFRERFEMGVKRGGAYGISLQSGWRGTERRLPVRELPKTGSGHELPRLLAETGGQ